MQRKRKELGIASAATAALLLIVLLSAAVPVMADEHEPPPETFDGLVLVPDRKVAAAYADPDADLSIYNKILLLDCYVAFRKDWQRDQNRSKSTRRVSAKDMEKIQIAVAELFREVMTETLGTDYDIVDEPGDDVLLVRPAIIDLDVAAPDTMQAGRTRTYTTTAGAATLFVELYDSVSGDIIARAADRKEARRPGNYLTYSNRVTNKSDAKRMMRRWANLLKDRLDEFHGKAGG